MSFEHGVIIFLCVLLLAQQVFWLKNVQRLVDKAMSKNYLEYAQAEVIKSQSPVRDKNQQEEIELTDDFSAQQAERANGLFGFSSRPT